MPENFDETELKDRLNLMETMIAQGRLTTGKWGWSFVLWGIAYYVAIGWSVLGRPSVAWPVTMIGGGVLTGIIAGRTQRSHPSTAIGRAIGSIWCAMGVSLFLIMMSLAVSGRLELHAGMAIVGASLGMANLASSIILKWKMQFASALVWLAAMEVACFGTDKQSQIAFLAAIFFCQIVFGIYAMISEGRAHRLNGAVHA